MSATKINVTFHDAAIGKPATHALPATATVAELQRVMCGGTAKKAGFTLALANGCSPSGVSTLADLAAAVSPSSDVLSLRVVRDMTMGAGCLCCNPGSGSGEKDATQIAKDDYNALIKNQFK